MESGTLRRNIWETSPISIEQSIPARAENLEIALDGRVLIGGTWEAVAETTRGEIDCFFGCHVLRTANGGDVRAGGGEDWSEGN